MQTNALAQIDTYLHALTEEVKAIRVDLSAALRQQSVAVGERRTEEGVVNADGQETMDTAPQGRDRLHLPPPTMIRGLIARRKLRCRYLDPDLFADPAWDMMLDLAAAEGENERISVTSLCLASGVAPTTALRWIAHLVEKGLVTRTEDSLDRRRVFVSLTSKSRMALARYFSDVRTGDKGQL
jgi:DNA-binding MarR family transcriptional regulator